MKMLINLLPFDIEASLLLASYHVPLCSYSRWRAMKVVILAGGQGTRIREESEYRPKPMVEIGNRPILWHIMKTFSHYGHKDFIVCAGYKGSMIKDYFLNLNPNIMDFTIDFSLSKVDPVFYGKSEKIDWKVTVVDTGLETQTGGRINAIEDFIENEPFFVTYGDGLADINLTKLENFHRDHGKIGTVTAIKPLSRFGIMEIDEKSNVKLFREKPLIEDWVNGGFFIFQPEIFNYLNKKSILEKDPLINLASDSELMAFKHEGFWQPMDTFRESQMLQKMWDEGVAPWKVW